LALADDIQSILGSSNQQQGCICRQGKTDQYLFLLPHSSFHQPGSQSYVSPGDPEELVSLAKFWIENGMGMCPASTSAMGGK